MKITLVVYFRQSVNAVANSVSRHRCFCSYSRTAAVVDNTAAVRGALQSMLTSQEARKIDRSVARQERLLRQQRDLETEVIELTRLAVVKVR